MTVREQLNALTAEELETVVAKVWEARGWQAKCEGNGDRGVVVRANKADPYPETEVIQVKYRTVTPLATEQKLRLSKSKIHGAQ